MSRWVPRWYERAKCAGLALGPFFSGKPADIRYAKRVCEDCPVRLACLDEALGRDRQWGVWGGLSAPERELLLRDRERRAAAGRESV